MAIAAALTNISNSKSTTARTLALTFSGNYTTGGDTLDLTQITNPGYLPGGKQFGVLPKRVTIDNEPDGYGLEWIPGSNLTNGKIRVTTTANVELAAGAYPAGITGDSDVTITMEWPSLL